MMTKNINNALLSAHSNFLYKVCLHFRIGLTNRL